MCSCQKKRELANLRQIETVREVLPPTSSNLWGPILWKFLHIAAEKSYSDAVYVDAVIVRNIWNFIIRTLPNVLPCPDCQAHARSYIAAHPFDASDKTGKDLQVYVREYLFAFHTEVRASKEQPVIVGTIDDCRRLYETQEYTQHNSDTLMVYFRIAVKYQVVQASTFNMWKLNYDRLIKMLHIY